MYIDVNIVFNIYFYHTIAIYIFCLRTFVRLS